MLGKIYQKFVVRLGDARASLQGPMAETGYTILHDYFNEEDLARFTEVSQSLQGSEESRDVLKKFPFLSKPLFDPKVIGIIRDYLGPKAVLDYASARRFLATGAKSDEWHHDSVGHRIKIFMCLTDQDASTHTQIIPATHLAKYSDYQSSKLRSDEIEKQGNVLNVIGKKNDLIFFDTNLMHKGVYSNVSREIVQFEFTDIRKSFMRGHVGIRKSIFDRSISTSPLISKRHLQFRDGYAYFN